MTLTRRERIMIIAGLIVVTLAAYIFYFIVPYANNSSEAVKRYGEAQAQLSLLKTKQTMAAQLQGEIDDLNGKLKSEGSAVPTGVDHARILLYLKKITDGKVVLPSSSTGPPCACAALAGSASATSASAPAASPLAHLVIQPSVAWTHSRQRPVTALWKRRVTGTADEVHRISCAED